MPHKDVHVAPYLYPPFLAVILTPLTLVTFDSAVALSVLLMVVSCLLLIPLLRHWLGWKLACLAVLGFTISLVGSVTMPLTITVCWVACCWPTLLRAERIGAHAGKDALEYQAVAG